MYIIQNIRLVIHSINTSVFSFHFYTLPLFLKLLMGIVVQKQKFSVTSISASHNSDMIKF